MQANGAPPERTECLLSWEALLIGSCLKNMQLTEILLQMAPICCLKMEVLKEAREVCGITLCSVNGGTQEVGTLQTAQ